jgi:DNA helicase II / ATP-dependent DNA helicase PcrA
MSDPIDLDASQQAVAFAPPEDRLYVTAAAGQGKTEVLLERIRSLRNDGLNPADEVLVLSFSRAAVETAQRRATLQGMERVLILTFDALAARILLDEVNDSDALSGSFEARVRRATELIHGPELPSLLESLRHVLIDEAQDLVGDRAELILAILEEVGDDLGFTVLGDPLQGIYDFQLDESVSHMTSKDFRERLIHDFGAETTQLEGHYRATSTQMESLIDVASSIRTHDGEPEHAGSAHTELDDFRSTLTSSSFLDEGGALDPGDGETTAILASTNYEILVASELLWDNGFKHVVRRRSQDMRADPWIHSVFSKLEARSYPESAILEILGSINSESAIERWAQLKNAEGDFRSHSSLNVPLLGMRLRTRSIPLGLTVGDYSQLTVSTVHRSKGLEFTSVIYLPPQAKSRASEISWPTARQKYVAVSRAREEVISSGFPKNVLKPAKTLRSGERWTELRFVGKQTRTARIEFMNSDIEDLIPVGRTTEQAQAAQVALGRQGVIGTATTGVLDDLTLSSDSPPRYLLLDDSKTIIGRTSPRFGYDLGLAFGVRPSGSWPLSFEGARITSVECAFGNSEETIELGLGPSGMWLVPRLTGLIRPHWKATQ